MINLLKNKLFFVAAITFIFFVSSANCDENISNCDKKPCNECKIDSILDDDEYSTYNQCFLDKQYRYLKTELCLEEDEENRIDNIYRNFKEDLEILCAKYADEKNKLLKSIACDNYCSNLDTKEIKKIKRQIKELYDDMQDDIYDELKKCQKRKYRKIARKQRSQLKKIMKYSIVYKLPCTDCNTNNSEISRGHEEQ